MYHKKKESKDGNGWKAGEGEKEGVRLWDCMYTQTTQYYTVI